MRLLFLGFPLSDSTIQFDPDVVLDEALAHEQPTQTFENRSGCNVFIKGSFLDEGPQFYPLNSASLKLRERSGRVNALFFVFSNTGQ